MALRLPRWLARRNHESALQERLQRLRDRVPIPLFWCFGKTQSGKTSIVRFLTGASDAEIGQGYMPCTRFSRRYDFPNAEAPLVRFLDTRGVDEPGYDPREDLAQFNHEAHVVIVTVKALDHALANVLENLRTIRDAAPSRPVVLAITCLHEAYPQQQHPPQYAFEGDGVSIPQELGRTIEEQQRRFAGLADRVVPIDLTRPEEGFTEPHYGGDQLKNALLEVLPAAYRQTLLMLDEANRELRDLYSGRALPHIVGYSTLAATAGAIPIPWLDLLILPGIQAHMIYDLAGVYGQTLTAGRFLELAGTLGLGMMVRQGIREIAKFIPVVGSVASAALAGATTFALGKAFCFYYSAVHQGHVPSAEELKAYYYEQLHVARAHWTRVKSREVGR